MNWNYSPDVQCYTKKKYKTEEEALEVKETYFYGFKQECMNVYYCIWCNHWHLGKDRRKYYGEFSTNSKGSDGIRVS